MWAIIKFPFEFKQFDDIFVCNNKRKSYLHDRDIDI
jgi:hypothetical protein